MKAVSRRRCDCGPLTPEVCICGIEPVITLASLEGRYRQFCENQKVVTFRQRFKVWEEKQ